MTEQVPPVPTLSLYVHVPFCLKRCVYCDFASEARPGGREGDLRLARYLEAVAKEAAGSERRGEPLATVYVGGGTPTALTDAELGRLSKAVTSSFDLSQVSEFTVEANPGTVDGRSLSRLRELGATRLSLGVQTFDDGNLRLLGRVHDSAEALAAFDAARAVFDDISLDLIFALPGQDLEDVRRDVARAVELGPENVSLYGLTYEPGTRLTELRDDGVVAPVADDVEREMYLAAIEDLEAAGLLQYEISNFAREGHECIHNQAYWAGAEYVGLGPSAASYLAGERRKNVSTVDEYVGRLARGQSPVAESERLDPEPAAREALMLALRTRRGADAKEFEARTGFPPDGLLGEGGRRLVEAGWLEFAGGRLRLARKALPVADEILAEIV
jgi:oxygen-independent coproporphyrinogen-3 oxidase